MDYAFLLTLLGILQIVYAQLDISNRDKTIIGSFALLIGLYPLIVQSCLSIRSVHERHLNPLCSIIHSSVMSTFGSYKDNGKLLINLQKGVRSFYKDDIHIYLSFFDWPRHKFQTIFFAIISPPMFCLFLVYVFLTFIPFWIAKNTRPCDPFSCEYQVRHGDFTYYQFGGQGVDPIDGDNGDPGEIFEIRKSIVLIERDIGDNLMNAYFWNKDQRKPDSPILSVPYNAENYLNAKRYLNCIKVNDTFVVELSIVCNHTRYNHCMDFQSLISKLFSGQRMIQVNPIQRENFFQGIASVIAVSSKDYNFLLKLTNSFFGEESHELVSIAADTSAYYRAKPESLGNKKWKYYISDISKFLYKKYGFKFKKYEPMPLSKQAFEAGYYERLRDVLNDYDDYKESEKIKDLSETISKCEKELHHSEIVENPEVDEKCFDDMNEFERSLYTIKFDMDCEDKKMKQISSTRHASRKFVKTYLYVDWIKDQHNICNALREKLQRKLLAESTVKIADKMIANLESFYEKTKNWDHSNPISRISYAASYILSTVQSGGGLRILKNLPVSPEIQNNDLTIEQNYFVTERLYTINLSSIRRKKMKAEINRIMDEKMSINREEELDFAKKKLEVKANIANRKLLEKKKQQDMCSYDKLSEFCSKENYDRLFENNLSIDKPLNKLKDKFKLYDNGKPMSFHEIFCTMVLVSNFLLNSCQGFFQIQNLPLATVLSGSELTPRSLRFIMSSVFSMSGLSIRGENISELSKYRKMITKHLSKIGNAKKRRKLLASKNNRQALGIKILESCNASLVKAIECTR